MTDDPQDRKTTTARLPKATITRWRWSTSVVWIVPLIAAMVAGYLIYGRLQEFGPTVTIKFKDGSGLRINQTPLEYRGVTVGEVTAIELTKDMQDVEVQIRLHRSASDIAKEGTVFWIERPEVGLDNIAGLRTVITGPEIQVQPGDGASKTEFTGLDSAPVAFEVKGLKIILRASHLKSIRQNSPIYYRGVEVGIVQAIALNSNATAADAHVLIQQRYIKLVRNNSVFWDVSGASMHAGLFSGIDFKMESLRTLATGGISFATPTTPSKTAREGTVFPLYAEAPKESQGWTPQITLPAE